MADQSEVDRVLAQYAIAVGGDGQRDLGHYSDVLAGIDALAPRYVPGPRQSPNFEDRRNDGGDGLLFNPWVRTPPNPPPQPTPAIVPLPRRAEGGEVSELLSQYGQGYTSPALNSGDGEIASTPDILAQYGANERMASGVPGFLRRIGAGLRSLAPSQVTTPVNTLTGREPPLQAREAHANPLMLMGGEGADTMASWIDMHPGVDRGQSRPQDLLAPLGLSAMAPLTAVNNAAGIFGGRLARTADREALSRAEEMAGRGATRNEIWDQTGWFQGVDGKWRFEIDDSLAGLSPSVVRRAQDAPGVAVHMPTTGESMRHPALFAAYPDAAQSNFTLTHNPREPRGSGAFHEGSRDGGVRDPLSAHVYVSGSDPTIQRSVALHELQHGIQDIEGFARGSNLNAAATPAFEAINAQLSRLARQIDDAPTPAAKEALRARYNELLDERSNINARDLYHRTAGEVEARNVMGRRDFSPEARRAVPPWRSQDVPDADQILRQYSSGPQMSAPHPDVAGYRAEGTLRPEHTVTESTMPMASFNGRDIRASQTTVDPRGVRYWEKQIKDGARPAILLEQTPDGFRIVDGHTRATAYSRAGIEDIPVLIRE